MDNRTLADFKAQYDPTHEVGNPNMQYHREFRPGVRTFIVVAAQNATPVHADWWPVLKCIANVKDAELVVIPLRYQNPTSVWQGSQDNAEWWDEAVRPHLFNGRRDLNKNLMILGDIKIQPTASSPLTGADAISSASSAILGHTKLQLRSIATPSNRMAKIQTTTGACTVENYTDSRAGKIGEFHHSLSAVIVEVVDDKHFHLTQLHFDKKTKSCTDRGIRYFADGFGVAPPALGLALGDLHVDFLDPGVERATWGPNGIVAVCRPQNVIFHDTVDSYSCSPHHKDNPFVAKAKQMSGRGNVRAEVYRAIDYVGTHTSDEWKTVIVPSNHDDMISRWVKRADWKQDIENAEFYLETALKMVRGTRMGKAGAEYPDPFTMWLRESTIGSSVYALERDESFVLGNVELGMHGDVGPNGSRGSRANLRRIGVRSIIGHSHSPGIEEGCYQTGTSSILRLEYTHGPSSWLNAHVLLNADGKRQLLIIVDGTWRG